MPLHFKHDGKSIIASSDKKAEGMYIYKKNIVLQLKPGKRIFNFVEALPFAAGENELNVEIAIK